MGELEEHLRMFAPRCGEASAKRGKLLADTLDLIEQEKGQLTLKFHIAKLILTGVPYDTGAKPFQDFEMLLKIRNSLITRNLSWSSRMNLALLLTLLEDFLNSCGR